MDHLSPWPHADTYEENNIIQIDTISLGTTCCFLECLNGKSNNFLTFSITSPHPLLPIIITTPDILCAFEPKRVCVFVYMCIKSYFIYMLSYQIS